MCLRVCVCVCVCECVCVCVCECGVCVCWLGCCDLQGSVGRSTACVLAISQYGVALVSRLLKMIGLFYKRALSKRRYSAKETYNFKEPINRSHPIVCCDLQGSVGRSSACVLAISHMCFRTYVFSHVCIFARMC